MNKFLIIAPNYPLPEDNGSAMRTMNFARYLMDRGDVDILCWKDNVHAPPKHSPFAKEFFLDNYLSKSSDSSYFKRIIDKLLYNKTWLTSKFSYESEKRVMTIINNGKYTKIFCRYISEAFPLIKLGSSFQYDIVLDVDDIVTESIYEKATEHISGIGKLSAFVDKAMLHKYYNRCMSFDTILFCSEEDRKKVSDPRIYKKSHVVPNVYSGLDLPADYAPDGYGNINNLLFVGALGYEPNYQGITWFITNVFPGLIARFPDIKLHVVGRNPPGGLVDLVRQHEGVELHANPPSIVPFYDRCGVVIVPLLAGGGTRIKILEAGYAKRPVISTGIGAYGLGLTDDENFALFSDAASFMAKYSELRADRAKYSSLTERLYRHIAENYSFENFCASLSRAVHVSAP